MGLLGKCAVSLRLLGAVAYYAERSSVTDASWTLDREFRVLSH